METSGGDPGTAGKERLRWLAPALVGVAALAAFLPALEAGFLAWDDAATVTDNERFRGLDGASLRWAFTTLHMGHYQPLSWLSLSLDHALWGLRPAGYHLTNLLLHAGSAVLVYLLALRLFAAARGRETGTAERLGALVAALFWALHPLRVESVAWVTERRDVLSGLWTLAATLLYLRAAAARRRWAWLTASVAAFALGLLSKAGGVTLVAVLVVLDVYPLRRLGSGRGWGGWGVWLEKVPFAALAGAAALVAPMAQRATGAMVPWSIHGPVERLAVAAHGLVFYLRKTLWPAALSPLYELPVEVDPGSARFAASFVLLTVAGVAAVWLWRRKPSWTRPLLAAAAIYVLFLLPVLGFFQSGPQLVADRYSYLATVPWAVLLGALFARAWARRPRPALAAGAVLVLALLAVLTWRQTRAWESTETLWRQALAVDPRCALCHEGLAATLAAEGRFEEAIVHYRAALAERPALRNARLGLEILLEWTGQSAGTEPQKRRPD